MVEGPPSMWANLKTSYPKIKKFHNSHLAEGHYNITSLESPQDEDLQIHDVEDLDNNEEHEVDEDDDDSITEIQANEIAAGEENEVINVERTEQQGTTTSSKLYEKEKKRPKKCEKEEKRPRKGLRIEDMMGRYLEMRTKQVEDEVAHLAKEKEAANLAKKGAEVKDFSITSANSGFWRQLNKAKDATLIWLKSLMD